jgi:TolA-binding protein
MEKRMKKRNLFLIILIAAMAFCLTACGPTDEKLAEVDSAISLLKEARQEAENVYLDVSETDQRAKLDEMNEKVAEFEAMEFSKMKNDEQIDEILPSIQALTEEYQGIRSGLADVLKAETAVKEEKAKHTELDAYFVNKTGMNITKIVLRDVTRNTESENFLGDGVVLTNGYTLMGPALDLYEGSASWEFVITDDADTEYTLSCESLRGKETKGVSIVLTYDKEKGEGAAEVSLQSGQ